MVALELGVFLVVTVVSIILLALGLILEKLDVCDEYVLGVWIMAPKATASAAWLMFVCYMLASFPREVHFWSISGYLIMFIELYNLFFHLFSAIKQCRMMKGYYKKFEECVLRSTKELSQQDFNRSVTDVITVKLALDPKHADYFAQKCRKYAQKSGLEWEV